MPGAKRGRLLMRQSRIKKDLDSSNQPSPEEFNFDTTYSQRLSVSSQHIKIERHVSEPAPRLSSPPPSSSMHLLSVPQQLPILTKQHSHPLLPSQSTSCDIQFSHHHPHLSLHRQLSYPGSTETSLHIHTPHTSSSSTSPLTSGAIGLPSAVTSNLSSTAYTSSINQFISTPFKTEEMEFTSTASSASAPDVPSTERKPSYVVVSEPLSLSVDHVPSIRVRSEELQRSISSPQVISLMRIVFF